MHFLPPEIELITRAECMKVDLLDNAFTRSQENDVSLGCGCEHDIIKMMMKYLMCFLECVTVEYDFYINNYA